MKESSRKANTWKESAPEKRQLAKSPVNNSQNTLSDIDSSINKIELQINSTTIIVGFYSEIPQDSKAQKELVATHHSLLPEKLAEAQSGRQAEFIMGRLLAQKALENQQIPNHIVKQNPDGSPAWPEGLRGSISHKKELAVAVVTAELDFLGIDLENLITDVNARKLAKRIVNEQEHALIESTDKSYGENFTRVFSAKEALYKAIYPVVQRYLPFSICQVTTISDNALTLQLQPEICLEIQRKAPFEIQVFNLKDKILTLAFGNKEKNL